MQTHLLNGHNIDPNWASKIVSLRRRALSKDTDAVPPDVLETFPMWDKDSDGKFHAWHVVVTHGKNELPVASIRIDLRVNPKTIPWDLKDPKEVDQGFFSDGNSHIVTLSRFCVDADDGIMRAYRNLNAGQKLQQGVMRTLEPWLVEGDRIITTAKPSKAPYYIALFGVKLISFTTKAIAPFQGADFSLYGKKVDKAFVEALASYRE
jgi:hypothetical protein